MALAKAYLMGLEWGHDWIVVETPTPPMVRSFPWGLEWGHDWIVVETFRPTETKTSPWGLEWGHDWIVVETRGGDQRRHVEQDLNGATTG